MVGLDLNEAVEAAYNNTKQFLSVHIVQGDIYNPPFREGRFTKQTAELANTFDFIYSIGVLHHLPDPQGGFTSLTRFLKPNATMFAWVYGPRYGISQKISVLLRRFTTKMDYRLLHAFCFSIALFLRTFSHLPYKVMRKVPGLRRVAEKLPIKEHHKYPFKVVVADAFDRLSVPIVNYYTAEQFRKWFDDAGLVDVKISERFKNNISWRGTRHKTGGRIGRKERGEGMEGKERKAGRGRKGWRGRMRGRGEKDGREGRDGKYRSET